MSSHEDPTINTEPVSAEVRSGVREQVKRLGGSTLIYGVGTIAGRLVGFLLLPLMTRYLHPSDYGLYSLLTLWSFLATSICSYGLNPGIVGTWYFESPAPERRERVLSTILALLAASAVVLVLLALLVPRPLAALSLIGTDNSPLLTLFFLGAAVNLLAIPPSMRLMFENRALAFVVISGIATLTTVALNVWMVVWLGRGVQGLAEAGLMAQTIGTLLFFVPRGSRCFRVPDLRLAPRILRQSLPMIPATGVLLLLQHGNKYVMQWFGQSDQLGIYSIGFNFGMFMQVPLSAFQTAWYPYFSSFVGKQGEVASLFGRITTYYVLGFGCLSLLFYAVAKPVVLFMTQPAFHAAYVVVGLSSTAQLLLSIHVVLLPASYFAREFGVQTAIQAVGLFLTGVACFVLIPVGGLLGAAVALVLGAAAVLALTVGWNWHRRRHYGVIRYERRRLAKFAALYVVLALLAARQPGSLERELLASTVLVLAIAGSAYACLTKAERIILTSPVKKAYQQWREA